MMGSRDKRFPFFVGMAIDRDDPVCYDRHGSKQLHSCLKLFGAG